MQRHYSPIDKILIQIDAGLNTVFGHYPSERQNPGNSVAPATLSQEEANHSAGLMRVNHSGEICAQALYRGQLNFAHSTEVRRMLETAAKEETDHLAWCDERLKELKSHRSVLNFFWYWNSYALGALAALIGDRWSLGFVEETEIQVEQHLLKHLRILPIHDLKSRMIVEQMKIDEAQHSQSARHAGAASLPKTVKKLMGIFGKLMTSTSYFL